MSRPVISRSEAKALGLTRYFIGKPCKRGHVAERYVAAFQCVECEKLSHARYRRSEKAKTREKAYAQAYRDAGKTRKRINSGYEQSEARKALRRAWQQSDASKARNARYRKGPKGKASKARDRYNRRDIMMMENSAPLTAAQWQAIKECAGYKCHYCRRKMKSLTMDHVIPISKGGHHVASNIVPACRSCNSKKRNKVITLL